MQNNAVTRRNSGYLYYSAVVFFLYCALSCSAFTVALYDSRGISSAQVGILLAAFFFSVLNVGGNVMQITCAVPTTFVSMLKGLMVLFILLGLSAKLKKKFRPPKKQACEDLKESVKSTVETTVKMKEREAV